MGKIIEHRQCRNCNGPFVITDWDIQYYKKINVPYPTFCPDCRQQRRLSFRNERYLYHRKCDLCGNKMISIYHPRVDLKVYCPTCWWSDKWDPTEYGRDFDFSKPFFEQFAGLKKSVPHLSLYWRDNENADYVNMSGYNKSCYLIFAADFNENCLYSTQIIKSKNCIDTLQCFESEYCYEVTDVTKCYELFFSRNCRNCHSGMFLYDCRGCADCLFCTNLRNKNFHIFNKPYSKETYGKLKQELIEKINNGELKQLITQFKDLQTQAVHRNLEAQNNENSTGNYLFDSKNCQQCFDLSYAEDCKYIYTGFRLKDMMDVCHATDDELTYEGTSIGYNSYNVKFAIGSWTSHDVEYVDTASSCSDLFGCAGMKYKKHCILNKQYSKEEYEALKSKIIEHMKSFTEYGEFFPSWISPLAYNETLAQDYYPLTEEKVLFRKLSWREKEETEYQPQTFQVPKNIEDVKDTIIQEMLACKHCGKNYKVNIHELKFYKKYLLPIPTSCPDCRHMDRLNERPKRKLFDRDCMKCGAKVQSTFQQNSPEIIYCEKCYLEKVV
ncbi:MAG: hypothetical protein WC285_03510 [Candidatus Gracilibacteria bacterium]